MAGYRPQHPHVLDVLVQVRTVVRLSDPRHFNHILPFLCPEDIPHCIDLSAYDICTMHEEDGLTEGS